MKQLADDVGYVFYLEPGPAAGDERRVLGSGDPRRRAAAGAQRRHGRAHQRRGADDFTFDTERKTLPIVFIQNAA